MSKGMKETSANHSQETRQISESLMAEVRNLEAQLRRREESLQLSGAALERMEERFANEIHILSTRVTAIEESLGTIKAQVQYGNVQIRTNAEENVKVQERLSSEIENLASELKEKKILLAAYEKALWRSNGRKSLWQRFFRRQNGL